MPIWQTLRRPATGASSSRGTVHVTLSTTEPEVLAFCKNLQNLQAASLGCRVMHMCVLQLYQCILQTETWLQINHNAVIRCLLFQGYDIYAVKNGDKATFTLTGDGGDINWGFIGTKIKRSGKTLQFS